MNTIKLQIELPLDIYLAVQSSSTTQAETEGQYILSAIRAQLKQTRPVKTAPTSSLIGLMAHQPEVMDEVLDDIMHMRQTMPWRSDEDGHE